MYNMFLKTRPRGKERFAVKKLSRLLNKPWAAYTFALCCAVVLYLLLNNITPLREKLQSLRKILSPVMIGLVLAYLIDPVTKFLERTAFRWVKKESVRRSLAVLISILFVLLLVTVFFSTLIPSLVGSITSLLNSANTYLVRAEELLYQLSESELGTLLGLESVAEKVENSLAKGFDLVTSNLTAILGQVGALGGKLFNWAIGLILSIYFLLGKKGLLAGVENLRRTALLPETYDRHSVFLHRCNHIFIQYIGCNLLDALIVGAANALFMTIFKMPYIPLVSVAVGFANLLPTFGPFIGAGIGSVILVLHKPIMALWFLVFTTVLQIVDGYLIKPRLFSSSLGIPAVWTLIAIILGGKFFGILGVLLAIPTAAVLTFLYKDNFLPWLGRRKKEAAAPR